MVKKRIISKIIIYLLLIPLLLPHIFTISYASEVEDKKKNDSISKGIVTASSLILRSEPSTSSEMLAELPQGTIVDILEKGEEWLTVNYENKQGYLFKEYVAVYLNKGITTADGLNVRQNPSSHAQLLDYLHKGTLVFILGEVKNAEDQDNPIWLKIAYLNGKIGYVSKNHVKIQTYSDGTYFKTYVTAVPMLNFRAKPRSNSTVTEILPEGSHLIFIKTQFNNDPVYQKWYYVNYNGKFGWVAAPYVNLAEWTLASKASTNSPSSSTNRNFNMKLAGNTLTGTIVLPGETFSWIDTMESCSGYKGFLVAPIYVNGVHSEGTGGGVCQVSTTFNMAIKKLGIQTNAHQHTIPVAYAKRSDEASVSYPFWDFSFKNTLDTPILIEFVSKKGAVTCNIYTPTVSGKGPYQ